MFEVFDCMEKLARLNRSRRPNAPHPAPHPAPASPGKVSLLDEASHFSAGENVAVHCHYTPKQPDTPPHDSFHMHDFFELLYVYSGSFINQFDSGETIEIGTDRLLLLNPYAVHAPRAANQGSIGFNILLKKSFVEKYLIGTMTGNRIFFNFFFDSLCTGAHTASYLIFDRDEALDQTALNLLTEIAEHHCYYDQMVNSCLIALFAQLARIQQQKHTQDLQGLLDDRKISSILLYVRHHYAGITLESTARHFSYSTAYLSRLIKKHTGQSFSELVTNQKLEAACGYLKNSSLSTDQITQAVGYNDSSYFCKAFKKKYCITPAEFRREHQFVTQPA